MALSATGLISEFFAPPKVTMKELKELTKEEREALADSIAKQKGLKKVPGKDGIWMYE